MWANAQRDGRPAEHRWRPLFNAAKFGWRSLPECRKVALPTRETRWNYLGCPKLAKRSQPLVDRSSPYCEDMWRRHCCLTSFFSRSTICALVAKIWPDKVARWRTDGLFFAIFWVQHFQRAACTMIPDLHSKFALGPHYVSKYGRHPFCDRWDFARKKKKKERNRTKLEMWANAQRDGRPAKYIWHHLFNTAVWLTPITTCSSNLDECVASTHNWVT